MRISTETYTLREAFDDEKAIRIAKTAGFDAVDYSFYWTKPENDMLGEDWEERAYALRGVLKETGMVCNQAHAPLEYTRKNRMELNDSAYLRLVRSVRFAAILGAEQIVIHSVGCEQEDPDFWEYNRAFYESFVPVCREYGIRIALENLFRWDEKRESHLGKMSDPTVLEAFTRSLSAPYFCNVVDIGHAALTGTEPETFLRKMHGDMVLGLHVQDGKYWRDDHTIPGQGWYHWDSIVDALREIGYRGDITLEAIGFLRGFPPEDLPLALELAKRCADRLRRRFLKES